MADIARCRFELRTVGIKKHMSLQGLKIFIAFASLTTVPSYALGASLTGLVLDLNGNGVDDAMVTMSPSYPGPTALTVFSDANGRFSFPTQDNFQRIGDISINVRVLGYEWVNNRINSPDGDQWEMTVIS
jgi:hypothetical protein